MQQQSIPTPVTANYCKLHAGMQNMVNHGTSKHYRIAQHFNKEHVDNGVAYFDYTSTKENEATCSPRS